MKPPAADIELTEVHTVAVVAALAAAHHLAALGIVQIELFVF